MGSADDLDLYSYVGGDPINESDPSGEYSYNTSWSAQNDDEKPTEVVVTGQRRVCDATCYAGMVNQMASASWQATGQRSNLVINWTCGRLSHLCIPTGVWIEPVPPLLQNEPSDARDPDGAKAPGLPGEQDGYEPPKTGPEWVKDPNGKGGGWKDKNGNVWVPTGKSPGKAHGGPHWDVQKPGGGSGGNRYPGGKLRPH